MDIKKRKQALDALKETPLPEDLLIKRKIYHGSNTAFKDFDFERGGGMVHFAENPGAAWSYANDLGSGGRNSKKWTDVRVEDVDTGDSFFYDKETKLWKSPSSGKVMAHSDFKEMMDEGTRYFEAYPKDANVRAGKVDMRKVLDTYPDRSKPFYAQANKKGLEEFMDIVDPSKITNNINPQFTANSQVVAKRLKAAAQDELKGVPGSPGFGNSFWGITKWSKGDEIREGLRGITDQLKSAGKDAIRFADDMHPTIAMFKPPEKVWEIVKRGAKPVMGAVAVGSAIMAPSADAAVADVLGVETMGVPPEQAKLDKQYRERTRYLERMENARNRVNEMTAPRG